MKTAKRPLARTHTLGLWRAMRVALAMLLFISSTAFAAQPVTGTFKGKVIGQFVTFTNLNKKVVTDWAGVLSLQLDRDTPGDGLGQLVPVFCIEVNVLVRGGDRYKSDGPVTALHGGCQIRYLLDRYPASTATNTAEAAARQLAIWHFSDDIDLSTVQEPDIRARALALADEAALAVALGGCPASQTNVASLTIDPPAASVVAGQAVNYTVRADPPDAAQTVDITISGSATLQNGLQQATLQLVQGVATFSVVNPVVGTSTITARMPYALDAGTVFSPINGARPTQRLVMGDRVSLSASATVQASWAPATETPTAGPPTETPIGLPSTATPNTAPPTATSIGLPSTATPAAPTSAPPSPAPPTPGTPGEAPTPPATDVPPPTATHKPSGGSKASPTPQATPESTPPTGGSPIPGPGTPTGPGTGPGNELPGGDNGAGTPGPGDNAAGGGGAAGGVPGGGANGRDVIRPSQLPNTGDTSNSVSLAITLAALLVVCGLLLRASTARK
jgi:LPXTG-motif cell wall-anchored protein